MKLRLYHHYDGARVAYRESGSGPALALFHSGGLSHREFEPIVERLSERFRLVLPDLPLHGDSEDRPRHPYTPEWLADVIAGFCRETLGPRPLVGGHDAGSDLLLLAVASGKLSPSRMVLMSSRLHTAAHRPGMLRGWKTIARAASVPGLDRALSHSVALAARPGLAQKLTVSGDPAATDLLRHALADVAGNSNRARSWARLARSWPTGAQPHLLEAYASITAPTLLLWADQDPWHPLQIAQEALARLPQGDLRELPNTGFLMAYDDPVGVGRELVAFLG